MNIIIPSVNCKIILSLFKTLDCLLMAEKWKSLASQQIFRLKTLLRKLSNENPFLETHQQFSSTHKA